jgi:RND family efflux transporter MFP subunit
VIRCQLFKLLMLSVLLVAGGCAERTDPASAPARGNSVERTFPVQALEVAERDLSRVIQLSAMVEPLRRIQLAVRTEGVLTAVLVEEGDELTAGQLVARIDVSEQRAELARAIARLDEQRSAYARVEQLRTGQYIDLATYDATRAALGIAEAEATLWETRVGFGALHAPISATVVERHVEPGEAVNRLQPVVTLADLRTQVVRIGVSELDVSGIDYDLPVAVTIDAFPDAEPLQGQIRRIFPAADATSRLVTVEIELPGAAARGIRPGYLARARLSVEQRQDVLAVPVNSIAHDTDGTPWVMVIDADSRLVRRELDIGASRGLWHEVTAGLAIGERIVASNPMELIEGSAVRIVGWTG